MNVLQRSEKRETRKLHICPLKGKSGNFNFNWFPSKHPRLLICTAWCRLVDNPWRIAICIFLRSLYRTISQYKCGIAISWHVNFHWRLWWTSTRETGTTYNQLLAKSTLASRRVIFFILYFRSIDLLTIYK